MRAKPLLKEQKKINNPVSTTQSQAIPVRDAVVRYAKSTGNDLSVSITPPLSSDMHLSRHPLGIHWSGLLTDDLDSSHTQDLPPCQLIRFSFHDIIINLSHLRTFLHYPLNRARAGLALIPYNVLFFIIL
ncbi:hypothetical protein ElyMa_005306000 [Elysia marginata]|uniref:Uncharacterized protein n=1 Tax=Elysia marginata TaxID=1093978 RepID=A0AAV4JZY8_9GAST|nr:hypothetical protein ElyMa_005306000 [Elysia marginata]